PAAAARRRPAALRATTRAMATDVTAHLVPRTEEDSGEEGERALDAGVASALEVFHEVEATCTRFGSSSALVRTNRSPDRWHRVPRVLFDALVEAHTAHDVTGGSFDPRVERALRALGYDRSLLFSSGDVVVHARPAVCAGSRGAWRPRFRHATGEVHLRGEPVDLGGIGKGLAVRWASARLAPLAIAYLLEAGGDCYAAGPGPDDGLGWRIAVEDPTGGEEPVAVLRVVDRAVTTSSVRLRRWRAGGKPVHHIVDPATGRPGGAGLLSVTTVGADPALGEVWSKSLFLAGRTRIATLARRRGLAALWVDEAGAIGTSDALGPYLMWRRP
ncbi:MAG: FAD:protein FMN transferase, partial [Acidimicrobiales bacterium]